MLYLMDVVIINFIALVLLKSTILRIESEQKMFMSPMPKVISSDYCHFFGLTEMILVVAMHELFGCICLQCPHMVLSNCSCDVSG